ncbi:MAG: Crp/Fnr family transcriptional regulator, partial [Brevundimonas sp.]
ARAINIAAGMDEAWLMDQIVRLGRLTAYERLSHLILELRCRLAAVDHTNDTGGLSFPPTQEVLGDATGLSLVHVNRTLRQLREDGMIGLRNGRLTIHDVPALAAISGFRPPRPSEWVDHEC